LEFQIYV